MWRLAPVGGGFIESKAHPCRPEHCWLQRARALLEQALQIDPDALDGLAFEQLGVLYYKTWRWPIEFWDEAKAGELLQRGGRAGWRRADRGGLQAFVSVTSKPLRSARLRQSTRRPWACAISVTMERPSPLPTPPCPGGR